MPLIDDPSVTGSLMVPRGYTPLVGSDEEVKPVKPVEPAAILPPINNWAPTIADKITSAIDPFFALGQAAEHNPTMSAAFRDSNTVGSAITRYNEVGGVSNDLTDPKYSPWEDVAGTKYEQYWKGTFSQSNNKGYTEALKRSIDRQEADKRTLDASGWTGTIAGIVAGTVDPTLLLPVGGEVELAGKGIWTVGRGALAGARAGAIGTAAYETALQGSQDIRTKEESFANIGTGVVLGAVLGGAISGALSRTQRVASEEGLERIAEMPVPGSVGAAAPQKMSLDDLSINGKITENLAAGTAFSPNLRGNFRESPLARQTYQEIATNTLRQNMHEEGLSLGPSVETNINVALGETIGQALEKHPEIFQEGKKNGFGLSADQFDVQVGQAMRRADEGVNTYVTKSAKLWRSTVIDPLTDQAIKLGLLPEDVSVREAPSYFSRMYNTEKMVAQKPQFMQIVTDHFHDTLQQQYAKSVDRLQTRTQDLDTELANLKLNPEERVQKLNELEAQRTGLEQQFGPAAEVADQIKNLKAQARKAKESGDEETARQLTSRADELKASGGEEFQTFKNEEAKLKKAARQINLGYGGLADKADRVSQQLTDLTHTNFKQLNRLVTRGQKLASELQKLDPEKLRQKVSDLRSEFYGLVTRSEQAQDRIAQQLQKLKPEEQPAAKAAAAEGLSRRDRIKAATAELDKTEPGQFKTVEPFPEEPGYHRFRYVAEDGTVVGGNYTIDGNLIEGFNIGDTNNPTKLGAKEVKKLFAQVAAQHPEVDKVHAFRMTGARAKSGKGPQEMWIGLTENGLKTEGAIVPEKVTVHAGETVETNKPTEGFTRVYRGEGDLTKPRMAGHGGEQGNWYTSDLKRAQKFARKNQGKLYYIDLDKETTRKLGLNVADTTIVPHELDKTRQPFIAENEISKTSTKASEAPKPDVNPTVDRLEKHLAAERRRTERLSEISDRLQAAEAVDNSADLAEIRNAIDEMVQEISNKSLGRGEKATDLLERLARLDPKKVDERIAEIEQLKRDLARKHEDQWAVRRLGEGLDTGTPDFSAHAKDMAQEVYDAITGNDWGSASVDPQFHLSARSGPLKDRTFHIPDEKIEPFLEDNVTKVMGRFARTMAAQIELARKFPDDPLLKNRFEAINKEYDTLVDHAKTEAERKKLEKDRKGTFRDLRALLEIHRGSYKTAENASSWGRAVRGTMMFNYLRSMGGAAIPSLSDVYGPALFHGFGNVMEVGTPALMQAITKQGLLVKEAQYAGVAERLSHHRLLTLTEIGDPYANGTAVERLLEQGSKAASKWNGLAMLTDFEKAFDGIVVQHRMNKALLSGKMSQKDLTWLAQSGLDDNMRGRIADLLRKHGSEEDGITVANTDQWDDWDAIRAYRAVLNLNVNADIVTRGIGDVPLAAYHPLGKAFLQFKTFNLAAHQRMFLRSAQLGPAQFLSGLMGLATLGMFTAYLKAMRGGKENFERFQESAKNPGFLFGEGIDNTGMMTLPIEIGNLAEKATGINPVKTPLALAGRAINPDASIGVSSQRYAQKSVVEALAGPTGGLIKDAVTTGNIPIKAARGKEITKGDKNAAQRLIPYQSYYGMRELLNYARGNSVGQE